MKHYYLHNDPDQLDKYEIYVVEIGSQTEQWLLDLLEVKRITRKEAIEMGLRHPNKTWLEGHPYTGEFVHTQVPVDPFSEEEVVADAVKATEEVVAHVAEERKKDQVAIEVELWREMNEKMNPT